MRTGTAFEPSPFSFLPSFSHVEDFTAALGREGKVGQDAEEHQSDGDAQRVLLFADGSVTFDNAFIELVVAFLGRPAGFGFALLKPLLNLHLTFYTRVGFLCGLRGAATIGRGEQKRERAENYCEG